MTFGTLGDMGGFGFAGRDAGGPYIAISASSVSEDASIGTAVGVLSVPNDTGWAFSITADPDNKFDLNVDGVTVETTATLSYAAATTHSFTVEADNGVDPVITRTIQIIVRSEQTATLSAPLDYYNGTSAATITVETDQNNGTLYWYVTDDRGTSTATLSATDLKAGTGAIASGSQAVTSTGRQSVSVTGLDDATNYFVLWVHVNGGTDSNKIRSDGFFTDSASGGPRILFEGDSITYYNSAYNYTNTWMADNTSIAAGNSARTSAGIGLSTDPVGTNSLFGRLNQAVANEPDLLTVFIGANDINGGSITTVDGSGPVASDWLTRLWAYVAAVRAQLPNVKIAVAGVMPMGVANGPADAATVNARRAIANPLIRAAVGSEIDAYIPFGDVFSDGMADDTTFYSSDGVHPFPSAGYERMSRVIHPILDAFVAESAATNPEAFTLIDQFNVALSGTSTADVSVIGLALGTTALASVSGGTIRIDKDGSFVSGPLSVTTGDIVEVQATGSASNDTDTDVALTIGDKADTFTARTIPANIVTFTHSTDGRLTASSLDGLTHVFSAVTFPEGRPVVMVCEDGRNETAVTIDGVSAERVGGSGDLTTQHSLWIGPPAQSLTAGTYDVRVTTTSGTAWASIAPGAITGCEQEVSAMSYRKIPIASFSKTTVTTTPALTVGNGALALYALNGDSASFVSFLDNGSAVYEYGNNTNFGNRRLAWGAGRVSGELGIEITGGSHALIVVELEYPIPDTLAPVLSSPTATETSDVAMSGTVTTDEDNGTLYWFISTSATPPSAANLKAGIGATAAGSQAVNATGVQNISDNGLSASTTYYAHYLHTDTASNDSNIVTSASFTTEADPASVLSSPTDTANGSDAMTGTVSTNESGGTLYWYISTSATPPSASDLKSGSGAVAAGSQAVSTSGVQNVSDSGLAAETTYYTHYIHVDTATNDSNIASSDGFTTTAVVSYPETNLLAHLIASDAASLYQTVDGTTTAVASDGDPVGYWYDQTANNFDVAAEADGTARPTYRTNSGNPYVEFDGSNDLLRRSEALGLWDGGTVAIAMRAAPSQGASRNAYGEGDTSYYNTQFSMVTSYINDDVKPVIRNQEGTFLTLSPSSGVYSTDGFDNTWHVFIVTHDPASNTVTMYQDGATSGTSTTYTDAGTFNFDNFALGAWARPGGTNFLACDMVAFMAWSDVKNETDRGDIYTYLSGLLP